MRLDTERTSENVCAVAERLDVKADSKALLFTNRACIRYVDEQADMQFFALLGGKVDTSHVDEQLEHVLAFMNLRLHRGCRCPSAGPQGSLAAADAEEPDSCSASSSGRGGCQPDSGGGCQLGRGAGFNRARGSRADPGRIAWRRCEWPRHGCGEAPSASLARRRGSRGQFRAWIWAP